MKMEVNRRNALKVLEWCKHKFGPSQINGPYPKLLFRRSKRDDCMGSYNPYSNKIEICSYAFTKKNRRFLTFINTIIHEFTHYHQPIKSKYFKYTNYDKNPLEIEANKIAKKYQLKCYEELFHEK